MNTSLLWLAARRLSPEPCQLSPHSPFGLLHRTSKHLQGTVWNLVQAPPQLTSFRRGTWGLALIYKVYQGLNLCTESFYYLEAITIIPKSKKVTLPPCLLNKAHVSQNSTGRKTLQSEVFHLLAEQIRVKRAPKVRAFRPFHQLVPSGHPVVMDFSYFLCFSNFILAVFILGPEP